MKKFLYVFFLLMLFSTIALASNETIDELIAQLEGDSQESVTPQRKDRQSFEDARKEIDAVKKHLRFRTDKVENVIWVNTKLNYSYPVFDIYCGERNGKIWLRLVAKPGAKMTPMVMERVVINVDGIAQSFMVPDSSRKITSNVSTSKGYNTVRVERFYMEEVDMPVNPEIEKLLRRAADGNETLIRLRGQHSVDFRMSKAAHTAFDAMLRYYKARQTLLYGYVVGTPNQ